MGVFDIVRTKISLNEKEEFYKKMIKVIKEIFGESPLFYYEVWSLLGIEYYFSESDAVYVWTKGGYNIGRYKEYYPIFIKVKKKDREVFEWYCEKLDLKKDKKGGVFYKVKSEVNLKFEDCEGIPVQSFKETIKFMKKNKYNFEPALEMVKELYNKKIKAKYKEVIVNVWFGTEGE